MVYLKQTCHNKTEVFGMQNLSDELKINKCIILHICTFVCAISLQIYVTKQVKGQNSHLNHHINLQLSWMTGHHGNVKKKPPN